MQTREYKVFGRTFNYDVSDSVQEMNALAGDDVAHDFAVQQVIYHNTLGRIRKHVIEAIEGRFPDNVRKRHTEKQGEKEVVVIDEKEAGYVTRMLGEGLTAETLDSLITAAVAATPFKDCLAQRERAPAKPKTLPKKVAAFIAALSPDKRAKLGAKMAKALKRDVDVNDDLAFGAAYGEYRALLEEDFINKL